MPKKSLVKIILPAFVLLSVIVLVLFYLWEKQRQEELQRISKERAQAEEFLTDSRKFFNYLEASRKENDSTISQAEYERAKSEYDESNEKLRLRIENAKNKLDLKKQGAD